MLALARADCIIVEEVATLSADLKAMAALPNDAARIVHRLVSSHDSLLSLGLCALQEKISAQYGVQKQGGGPPPKIPQLKLKLRHVYHLVFHIIFA